MKYILFKNIDHHMSLVDALMDTQFSKVNKILNCKLCVAGYSSLLLHVTELDL